MEQKLAEFRARRQAENAAKKTKGPEWQTTASSPPSSTPSTGDGEQTQEAADRGRDRPESTGRQVRVEEYWGAAEHLHFVK